MFSGEWRVQLKLSSKGRYATRAMLDLAIHFGQGVIKLKDISKRQQISALYLEQIFIPLRRAGLVRSLRGLRGGFTLAKPPQEIPLSEIFRAVEGSVAPVRCVDKPGLCQQSDDCITRNIWAEIGRVTDRVLESITLQDLASQHVVTS
jgi:Rrf2 family protein